MREESNMKGIHVASCSDHEQAVFVPESSTRGVDLRLCNLGNDLNGGRRKKSFHLMGER